MSKAKQNKVPLPAKVQEGFKAKDLNVEKRVELADAALISFNKMVVDKFGLGLDIQLRASNKGIIPVSVWVDVLKKDEQTKTEVK